MTNIPTTPVQSIIDDVTTTASHKVRMLFFYEGFTKSQITKMLTHKDGRDMRYQMVREIVLSTKKGTYGT